MNRLFVVFSMLLVVSGCSHTASYSAGQKERFFSSLCEKSKQRIQDMQRIDFELPEIFKTAPCSDGGVDYIYDKKSNRLNVEVLGGEHRREYNVEVQAGFGRAELFLSPEALFEERVDYLSNHDQFVRLINASWVPWRLGRCARFYANAHKGSYMLNTVEYYCWEGGDFANSIYIYASERQPILELAGDLDAVLIIPILDSVRIKPVAPDTLAEWNESKVSFCRKLKSRYDSRLPTGFSDSLDQRRMRTFLRACGYEISDPLRVVAGLRKWDELFRPDGQLLGEQVGSDSTLRVLPKVEFDRLEEKLLALRVKPSKRPEARFMKLSKDGNFTVEAFSMKGEYPGTWYQVPPDYGNGSGFGIREDKDVGRVIDVYNLSDHIPFGFRFVSE